jgi:hypothetical protein
MKTCYRCKKELEDDKFGKNKSKPSGLADECKVCKSELCKEYQKRHKDKIKLKKHQYYIENKTEITEKTSLYAKEHREWHNAKGTKAKNKLKSEVFSVYSCGEPKCKSCNESELGVLTIDHVNGEGAEHRRELFGNNTGGGYKMYQWLKKKSYPEGFQVLCYNCQYRKRMIEMKAEEQTHLKEVRAAYARSIKIECLESYGGCKCQCGENDVTVLTLDHVNDDGAEHRRETNTRGLNFYFMLRKNGFPSDPPLQVLCMNCNIRKRNAKYQEGKDG